LNVAGLFITGLGFANMYPLMLALTLGIAPQQVNVASARISLGIGFCILLIPYTLGLVAQVTDIRSAYSIVGVLLILDIALAILAGRLAAKRKRGQAQG
jgi:fucose permease